MLIFCEDCGKKHSIETDLENPVEFKFRCDACGFLIPVLPPRSKAKREDKELEPDLLLIPSHQQIDFGVVQGSEEKSQMLLVAAGDGRKINLQGMVTRPLTGNVTITRVSRMSFMITVVDPADTASDPVTSFDDKGIELVDTISGAKVSIHISFTRTEPHLNIEPAQVDLGPVTAGSQASGSFYIQNCGNGTLQVNLVPDPEYFTITTYFSITSPLQYALEPEQKQEIQFFVKVDPEVQKEEVFTQPVLIMSNDPNGDKVGRVMITAEISGSSRKVSA